MVTEATAADAVIDDVEALGAGLSVPWDDDDNITTKSPLTIPRSDNLQSNPAVRTSLPFKLSWKSSLKQQDLLT